MITEFAPINEFSPILTLPQRTAPGPTLTPLEIKHSCSIMQDVFRITKSSIFEKAFTITLLEINIPFPKEESLK